MFRKTAAGILAILPQRLLSRLIGCFARSRWSKPLIKPYAACFSVDLSQIEKPVEEYRNLCEFFTRKLKAGARPLNGDADAVVSPVDGVVSQVGKIDRGTILQAKGLDYTVEELLAGDREMAERFRDGRFITLYLSPRDYHRIHMPLSGTLLRYTYVPGRLFPVNALGVHQVKGLFSRNERLITYAETEAGYVAIVKVGAFIVGSVKVRYGSATTNVKGGRLTSGAIAGTPFYEKGAELGYFEFGSTVILLFEEGAVEFLPRIRPGLAVKMGEKIGTITKPLAEPTGDLEQVLRG
ncbi:hypothetical protein BSNK01_15660 [Bacillaceae bacterium]